MEFSQLEGMDTHILTPTPLILLLLYPRALQALQVQTGI
jgi:hypothetical protein